MAEKTTEAPAVKAPRVAALREALATEKAKLEALLKPARDFYEKHMNDPKYLEARKVIKEVSAKLIPINNEIAAIVRSEPTNKGSLKAEGGKYE